MPGWTPPAGSSSPPTPLVDYCRGVSGEHPDWDEYIRAMQDQGKCLIRITIERWGPIATGGFPPEPADG